MRWIAKLYALVLKSTIENDKDLKDIAYNADIKSEITRKKIMNSCDGDKEKVKKAIPEEVRKYLGFDF